MTSAAAGLRLTQRIEIGAPAFGAWLMLGSTFAAEVVAECDPDYIVVDCQHGVSGHERLFETLGPLTRMSSTVLVRVPQIQGSWIPRALDAGAAGIIVPMVNSASEARTAVAACRYGPDGVRSYGPLRARVGSTTDADKDVLVYVMIETAAGLAHVAEIAAVSGVTGIYVGPVDLGISLGEEPLVSFGPKLMNATDEIFQTCRSQGIAAGFHCLTGESARAFADRGFDMVTVSSDLGVLRRGFKAELEAARLVR